LNGNYVAFVMIAGCYKGVQEVKRTIGTVYRAYVDSN
jgi:hypothetical protein